MFKIGQVLLGKLPYQDGEVPNYLRPYLIVEIGDNDIGVLIISSSEGKEHKLLFKSNYSIKIYNPPLLKPSFVKLDSLQKISISTANKMKLLDNGKSLNEEDVKTILLKIK